jgi:urease accessory protein
MTSLAPLGPDTGLQRSSGRADVVLGPDGRLVRLHQQGSAKAIPLGDAGRTREVTFLNTSGGLAGGDSLSLSLALAEGVRAMATTQTAERAYRSTGPAARVDIRLDLGAGAHLDWLPQETILFDRSHLSRRTMVTLGEGASCLLAETLVLGRAAMGETVRELTLRDWREVRQLDGSAAGRPIWLDPLALTPEALHGPATLQGARAICTVALIGAGAGDALGPLRQTLNEPGATAAASALPGRLLLRLMAADLLPLRRQLIRALAVLRQGRPLPRVWQS